jgi:osmotically-inducible protein OsmY
MSQSAPGVLLSPQHDEAARNADRAAALLVAQGLVDLCLAERVEGALRATGYSCLRAVAASVCGQLVVLRGRVPSYYLKQIAQAAALGVPGVRELRNDVEVDPP